MGVQEHTSPAEERESTARQRRRRIVGAAALTAALIAGVLALTLPAVAQTDPGDGGTDTDGGAATSDTSTAEEVTLEDAVKGRLAETLAPLVADGTISDEQRDAVIEALWTARRSAGDGEKSGRRHGHAHGGLHAMVLPAGLTDLLDLTADELAAALRAGDTLADLAADAGVETSAIVDLLVEGATGRIDAAVEAGRIETDDRDTCITAITAAVTAHVNGGNVDRSAFGDSCGHGGDHDDDERRGALGRLQFRR